MCILGSEGTFYRWMERFIERLHDSRPFCITFCYLVELFFYACREVVVHDAGEVLHQEVGYNCTSICR